MPSARTALAVSLVALALTGGEFCYVAWKQVTYPGFAEAMEGDALQHIERVLAGKPVYPAPGPEYVALAYMPLYYLASAPLYAFFGDSFVGPRLLSALAAIVSGGLLALIAWKETRSGAAAAIAASLYFAGYRVMDGASFCALPDSFVLFWILTGFLFFAYGTKAWHDVAWLVAMTLAFWTKQHGAIYFGWFVLYALVFRRNFLPKWAIVAAILVGGPVSYLTIGPLFGDHFVYHTWSVPGHWPRSWPASAARAVFVLTCFLPFSALLSATYIVGRFRESLRPTPLIWFWMTALATSGYTMTVTGASNNHYIPLVAASCVVAAVAATSLIRSATMPSLGLPLVVIAAASAGILYLGVRNGEPHPLPLFAPAVVVSAAVLWALLRTRRFENLRSWAPASILILGQLIVSLYDPRDSIADPALADCVAELKKSLGARADHVVWIDYGNVPTALIGAKFHRAPSWVALEDVERQVPVGPDVKAALATFRQAVEEEQELYLLSNGKIDDVPLWKEFKPQLELVEDFKRRFAGVRQVAIHWYGGRSFPRYLYRLRRSAVASRPESPKPGL